MRVLPLPPVRNSNPPDGQTAALLHTILLTLNDSTTQGETLAVPPVEGEPPSNAATAIRLFYLGTLVSMLATFFATLAGECLTNYLLQGGGGVPAIYCSAGRQPKIGRTQELAIRSPH